MPSLFDPQHVCYTFNDVAKSIHHSSHSLEGETFALQYLNGLMTTVEENIISNGLEPVPSQVTIRDGQEALGEWLGIFNGSKGSYIVLADAFGYQPVFYRSITNSKNSQLLIGTSIDAVSQTATKYGAKLSLHREEFLSHIGTTDPWSVTMQSTQSLEASTRILLPGESLVISNGHWWLNKSDFFRTEGQYDDLIEQGMHRSIRQLQTATRLDVDQLRINLSGGKDSRMVLALLTAADVHADYTVTAMNPRTWTPKSTRPIIQADLEVSNGLRHELKMNWTRPLQMNFQPMSFEESLSFWHAYRGHRNYNFKANGGIYLQTGTNVELRGAGGETFRGFKTVRSLLSRVNFENTPRSLKKDTQRLTDYIYGNRLMDRAELQATAQRLSFLFEQLGSETISHALQRRYSVFRNRSHFGHIRYSMAQGQYPVLPLCQPEFVQAAECLGNHERNCGKVAFDVIERACPLLNELPFDDGKHWNESLMSRSRRRGFKLSGRGAGLDDFYEIDERAVHQRVEAKEAIDDTVLEATLINSKFESINRVKQLLADLNSLGASGPNLSDNQQRWILNGVDSLKFNSGIVLSKLHSAWMAVSPELKANEVVVTGGKEAVESIFKMAQRVPTLKRAQTRKHPQFQLPVQVEGNQITAAVTVYGSVSEPMEYSFRLIKDHEIIQETAYSKIPSASFALVDGHHKLRVEANVRYRTNKAAVYRFFSRFI